MSPGYWMVNSDGFVGPNTYCMYTVPSGPIYAQ
jgi:hypothetical protein